jgi:hypothetical protein
MALFPHIFRNILVSAAGLQCVKLSDVGMARSIATSQYYRKQSKDKVAAAWFGPKTIPFVTLLSSERTCRYRPNG